MKTWPLLLAMALGLGGAHAAETPDPWAVDTGPLRIEGPAEMAGVMQRWIAGFGRQHPGTALQARLRGTDVGLGALVTGRADVAFAGRDATPPEVKAFEWIFRYRPVSVDVMTGSLDHPGRSPALAVLVHRDNPLRSIGAAQLDRLFNADGQGGRPPAWRRWGEAGLGGDWAGRPIRLYMPGAESGTGSFFRSRLLANSRTLPWGRLTEIDDARPHDAGRRLARAVARDRDAIAVAPLSPRLPAGVKVLPIESGGESVTPTPESLVTGRYVLGRVVHAYVNAAPARPIDPARAHALDPRVAEFLRYVLGPEGQRDVADDAQYLPLDVRQAVSQRDRIR